MRILTFALFAVLPLSLFANPEHVLAFDVKNSGHFDGTYTRTGPNDVGGIGYIYQSGENMILDGGAGWVLINFADPSAGYWRTNGRNKDYPFQEFERFFWEAGWKTEPTGKPQVFNPVGGFFFRPQ